MATMRNPVDCSMCGLKSNCFLQTLTRGDASRLPERTALNVKKREILHREGDAAQSATIVCAGRVKVYKLSADGKTLITKLAHSGDVIGLGAVFGGRTHADYAEAIEPAVVVRVDRNALVQWMARDPYVAGALLAAMGDEVQHTADQALHVAYASASDRVVDTLKHLMGKDTRQRHDGVAIKRQDLADLTGLTIETTVRTLKALEREGIVRLDGNRIAFNATAEFAFAA